MRGRAAAKIAATIGALDSRRFTYLNEGEPVVVGDFVKVPDARSDAWKRVEVTDVDVEEPEFVCKPIIGKLTGEDLDEALLRRAAVNTSDTQ